LDSVALSWAGVRCATVRSWRRRRRRRRAIGLKEKRGSYGDGYDDRDSAATSGDELFLIQADIQADL
jgi:hypothetical protein